MRLIPVFLLPRGERTLKQQKGFLQEDKVFLITMEELRYRLPFQAGKGVTSNGKNLPG